MLYPTAFKKGEGILPLDVPFIYKLHVCVPLLQQELHDSYHRLNKQSDMDPVLLCICPHLRVLRNLRVLEFPRDSECV